jgi:DAACS family dicarboxylate/amino acid:cation (Na+ or H+) symporter
MLVVPLMFSALVLGVAELGDIASLGRLGWRTLVYTAVVTGIAVGHRRADGEPAAARPAPGPRPRSTRRWPRARSKAGEIASKGAELNFIDLLVNIVPHNVIQAATDDKQKLGRGVLRADVRHRPGDDAIAGDARVQDRAAGPVRDLHAADRADHPAGALRGRGFMFNLTANLGWDVITGLAWFVLTVLLGAGAARLRGAAAVGALHGQHVAAGVLPRRPGRRS